MRFLYDPDYRQTDVDVQEERRRKRNIRVIDDVIKSKEEKVAENKEKFESLVRGSKVLYELRSVFPFDLFPDTVTIDSEKVNITFKDFFLSARLQSYYIKNISYVYVDTGPLFASLNIVDEGLVGQTGTVSYLKKDEALCACRIIQGLIVTHKEDIDLSKIEDKNLVPKIEKLGEAS